MGLFSLCFDRQRKGANVSRSVLEHISNHLACLKRAITGPAMTCGPGHKSVPAIMLAGSPLQGRAVDVMDEQQWMQVLTKQWKTSDVAQLHSSVCLSDLHP